MKEYIGYPEEILDDWRLEELYEKLEIDAETHFNNGISMSVWATNYAWRKLRYKQLFYLSLTICRSLQQIYYRFTQSFMMRQKIGG